MCVCVCVCLLFVGFVNVLSINMPLFFFSQYILFSLLLPKKKKKSQGYKKFSLYNGMVVTVVEPQPNQSQGFDEDPLPVKCILQATGDGLIETYLDDKPEQHLAASMACTIATTVGVAGMTADEMLQWCQANMVALRQMQAEWFGEFFSVGVA